MAALQLTLDTDELFDDVEPEACGDESGASANEQQGHDGREPIPAAVTHGRGGRIRSEGPRPRPEAESRGQGKRGACERAPCGSGSGNGAGLRKAKAKARKDGPPLAARVGGVDGWKKVSGLRCVVGFVSLPPRPEQVQGLL